MKHTKHLVVALLVALLACLAVTAMADDPCAHLILKEDEGAYRAPTCLGEGVQVFYCTNPDCDYVQVRTIPALGHNFPDLPTRTKEATCGAAGRLEYQCTRCDHVKKVDIPATGNHEYQIDVASEVPPTCVANGVGPTYFCVHCGKKMAEPQILPPLGHSFKENAWIVEVPATCAQDGILARFCDRCGYRDQKNVGKADHHTDADGNPINITASYNANKKVSDADYLTAAFCILPARRPTCTTDGCYALFQCPTCGATKGGDLWPAFGHDVTGQPWEIKTRATCASEGVLGRKCINCGAWIETKSAGKAAYHTDGIHNYDLSGQYNTYKKTALDDNYKTIDLCIMPARKATCTDDGCYAIFQCPICGATKGGDKWAASGHNIAGYNITVEPTCENDGKKVGHCTNCNKDIEVKLPKYGHSGTWTVVSWPTSSKLGESDCVCSRCGKVIGIQWFEKAADAPSGTVNTGVSTTTKAVSTSGSNTAAHEASAASVVKTTTTTSTSSTAKSTSKKTSTASKSTSSTKSASTAAAPAAATTKVSAVAVVAAPAAAAELPANAAALKADTKLYIVKNAADADTVLTVDVADGKITVSAELAEGEVLVLYADADAIANPTAENTLILTANEAVELPANFANAILAIVKADTLPTAIAAK